LSSESAAILDDGPARSERGTVENAAKVLLPWLVAVALFMESLDTTILNTAVPTVAEALSVAPLSMKSALTSYALSLAVFIPLSGWIADRFGTRRVFFTAIGIFTFGSLLCGLATNLPMLVVARIVQGCGGAMMMPVGRIALVRTFARHELLRALTFVAIPALVGPLLGPLVGGLLVTYAHWRMIFFVNLPVGLVGIALALRYMPDYRADHSDPIDLKGLLYFGSGVAILSYVLEVFGEHTLALHTSAALIGVALLLLFAYGIHTRSAPFPLLRLQLFGTRTFRVSVIGGFITRLGAGGMPFLLPLLYQVGLGYSPVQSGMLIMPQPLAAMGMRVMLPRLLRHMGYRNLLLVNTTFMGLLSMCFALVGVGTPAWGIAIGSFLFGTFSSMQYSSLATLTFADVPNEDASKASSISSTVQQLSMSFGVATASLLTALFVGDRHSAGSAVMITGIHSTFVALGVLTIAAAIMFRQLSETDGAAVSLHDAQQPRHEAHPAE